MSAPITFPVGSRSRLTLSRSNATGFPQLVLVAEICDRGEWRAGPAFYIDESALAELSVGLARYRQRYGLVL